jgi:hypothetical protein
MKPLYIFDLDGTIALIEHRRHLVEGRETTHSDWKNFYAACDQDMPNLPVIATMESLRKTGADIWIFSGRSDEVREKSVMWLEKHTSFRAHELHDILMMRQEGDFTPDDLLKGKWLEEMLISDKQRLVASFDDRDRVVAMWRAAGIPCFQVAAGDF